MVRLRVCLWDSGRLQNDFKSEYRQDDPGSAGFRFDIFCSDLIDLAERTSGPYRDAASKHES